MMRASSPPIEAISRLRDGPAAAGARAGGWSGIRIGHGAIDPQAKGEDERPAGRFRCHEKVGDPSCSYLKVR